MDWTTPPGAGHFWIAAGFSEASLNEAHWLRVTHAAYSRRLGTIDLNVENLKPMSGDPNAKGVAAPRNLPVTLTFDLQRIGLPTTGTYTLERVGKDDGSFSQTFVTASDGKVQATVPQGAFILRLSAGGQPPTTKTLSLRQGVDGYSAGADTYINGWDPAKKYGGSYTLSLRADGDHPVQTGLLRFDLAGRLPAGATVRFAVLSVRVTYVPNGPVPLAVDRINRPWSATDATWTQADGATPWNVAGANGVPADRAGQPADSRTVYPAFTGSGGTDATIADWYGLDVTGLVAGWAANPASNWGMALRVDPQEGAPAGGGWDLVKDGFSIASSDYLTSGWRPQLFIVYTQDPLTPTPSNTPTATATPTLTPTATNTPTATATPPDGSITGLVFVDSNRNGVHEAGEAGVAGRLVQLKRNGAVANNVTSDSNGWYVFDRVTPGAWEVDLNARRELPGHHRKRQPGRGRGQRRDRDGSRFRAGVWRYAVAYADAHAHRNAHTVHCVRQAHLSPNALERKSLMDFVGYYDAYWQAKGDGDNKVDQGRLRLVAEHVLGAAQTGALDVLQVDGGPGWLAKMLCDRGAHVVMTDLSHVAVEMARRRGVDARQCEIDAAPLPFGDNSFDTVVCDSQLEHRFDPDHALDEMARVLRPGGRLVLLLPNTAHWRVRWWLLRGRFPVVVNTPTDWLHIRFFTLSDIRDGLDKRGIAIEKVDGSASLWVKGLYPAWLRRGLPARVYTRLARRRPGLFARDFIVVGRKAAAATVGREAGR